MQMVGEQRVAASTQQVWEALNDPQILQASIPGCQSLEKESDERFTATVEVKVGPIGARFKGAVTLTDLNPPNSYTLLLEGNGGIAGSMKGAAKVKLSEADGGTLVSYEVDAQVGGRMAQLGGPIIDATAKQLAGKFFGRFGEIVSGARPLTAAAASAPSAAAAPGAATAPVAAPATASAGCSAWAGMAIGLLLIVVAAVSFEYGRRSAAPTIVIEGSAVEKLIEAHSHHGQGDKDEGHKGAGQ